MKKIGEFVLMTIAIFIAGVMNPVFIMFVLWMKERAGFENALKEGTVLLLPISIALAFVVSRDTRKTRVG